MAAKRISKHTVDLAKMIETMNPWEQARLRKFKAVADTYVRKVQELPDKPPEINFNAAKSKVQNKAVVEKLEAAYKAALASVPYPKENYSEHINKWEEEAAKKVPQVVDKFTNKIDECHQLITKFEKMIPFHDMGHDDHARTFPEWDYISYSDKIHGITQLPTLDPRIRKGLDEYHMYFDGTKDVNDPKEPMSKYE